jgi:PUA-domain protein
MKFLSNREKKNMIDQLPKGYDIEKKDEIKTDNIIIYKNGEKYLIIIDNNLFPHLKTINEEKYRGVFVDKGAIPFILKGADLMRPGIQKVEHNFDKNDIVMIKDENHKKLIALGISMYPSEELEKIEKGKVIKIFHFVGDQYY